MIATPAEKELEGRWREYWARHPEKDLSGGGH
jgi:hypothetical protein